MENVTNITSEEELLQLRNEGKISEDEYDQLREALQKGTQVDIEPVAPETDKSKSKRKLGIAAFVLMLAGIILPGLCYFAVDLFAKAMAENALVAIGPWFFLGLILEIAAFGTGIASWRNPFGKAATISSFLLLVFVGLSILFFSVRIVKVIEPIEVGELNKLKHFSLDSMDGIITQSGVEIDKEISSDGNGSLRIEATEPVTVRLFETGDIDIEDARLIYQARVRTENVEGHVYLEMWCHFPGRGEFFSRGLMTPLTGTTDWATQETPFFLKVGENPDNVKLNLAIDGQGTVWIDDIRLLKELRD